MILLSLLLFFMFHSFDERKMEERKTGNRGVRKRGCLDQGEAGIANAATKIIMLPSTK